MKMYNHAANLVKGYTKNIINIIRAAGGKVKKTTPYCYSRGCYSASWIQRVEYVKDGEDRVAYQYCLDGLYDEIFGDWFWCPAEKDCSIQFANRLVRPEHDRPTFFDQMPDDMKTKTF